MNLNCICPDGAVDPNCTICNKAMNNIKPDLLAQFAEECAEFPNRNALNMYQTLATGTAVYPGQGTPLGLVYVALKGAGEAGEFAEHVGKAMRDDGLQSATPMPTAEQIEQIAKIVFNAMRFDREESTKDWIENGNSLAQSDARMSASAISEILTISTQPLTEERKALLIKELGDRLWYISAACNELGITLADAALINVQKLKDRQERGVLRGSGDSR